MADAALMQGLANTIQGLLPKGEVFVLMTFPESGSGDYAHITNAPRAPSIKHLRTCADVLERRGEQTIPPGVNIAKQGAAR